MFVAVLAASSWAVWWYYNNKQHLTWFGGIQVNCPCLGGWCREKYDIDLPTKDWESTSFCSTGYALETDVVASRDEVLLRTCLDECKSDADCMAVYWKQNADSNAPVGGAKGTCMHFKDYFEASNGADARMAFMNKNPEKSRHRVGFKYDRGLSPTKHEGSVWRNFSENSPFGLTANKSIRLSKTQHANANEWDDDPYA